MHESLEKKHLSLFELYRRALPFLAHNLVSDIDHGKILSFTQLLSQNIEPTYFGFEFPLGEKKTYADIGFSLDPSSFDTAYFNQCFSIDALSPSLKSDNSWKELSLLLKNCQNENFYLKKEIFKIWLEFDIGSSLQWPPSPNVLFSYQHTKNLNNIEDTVAFLGYKNTLERVKKTINVLNTYNMHISTLGFMIGRDSDWIKLCFRVDHLVDKLEKFFFNFEYFYNVEPLIEILSKLTKVTDKIHLQIDMNTAISSKIGIECFPISSIKVKELTSFLEFFLTEHLISHEEYNSILSWRGVAIEKINNSSYIFARFINHIKLDYYPEKRAFKSKVYLGACREPRN